MRKVLLIEDHTAFRQTLALMLEQEPDFEVFLQAGTLEEARRKLESTEDSADVGIVDLTLTDGEGLDLIEELQGANPDFAAMVLTASLERGDHARAVEAGASGVLHKSADVDEILSGVRRIMEGETLFSPSELVELLQVADHTREEEREARTNIEKLTPREMDVLQALAEGLSNKEIAEKLYMSLDTERTHMMNVLNKLGVHSRLQALLFAARYGVVDLG